MFSPGRRRGLSSRPAQSLLIWRDAQRSSALAAVVMFCFDNITINLYLNLLYRGREFLIII